MKNYLIIIIFFSCVCACAQQPQRPVSDFSIESLANELKARNPSEDKSLTDTIPLNDSLRGFTEKSIYEALMKKEDVIYGEDNRVEVFAVSDPAIQKNARSVVGFFRKAELDFLADGSGNVNLKNKVSFRTAFSVCDEETFSTQLVAPYCTGFAVSDKLIVSAGHCMKNVDLDEFVCIFGYQLVNNGQIVEKFNADQVFYPESVKNGLEMPNRTDYLIVKVKGKIPENRICAMDRRPVAARDSFYVIGHPCGLPMKVGLKGGVRYNDDPLYFVSNLDTYGGNSGSPVFNVATNKVVGILIKGEQDFISVNGCMRSRRCKDDKCRGEDATRITQILSLVSGNDTR